MAITRRRILNVSRHSCFCTALLLGVLFDRVAIGDMSVQGIQKLFSNKNPRNKGKRKAASGAMQNRLADVSAYQLRERFKTTAARTGTAYAKTPERWSTSACPLCGCANNVGSAHWFVCTDCGCQLDRDGKAAAVIRLTDMHRVAVDEARDAQKRWGSAAARNPGGNVARLFHQVLAMAKEGDLAGTRAAIGALESEEGGAGRAEVHAGQ